MFQLKGNVRAGQAASDSDAFHFIERDFVIGTVVELCRARRFMGGDSLSLFYGSAVLQVGGDPGCPKCMAADFVGEACPDGSPLDHPKRVIPGHPFLCQLDSGTSFQPRRNIRIAMSLANFDVSHASQIQSPILNFAATSCKIRFELSIACRIGD